MQPRTVTVGPLAAASANNIAQSQTPGAAGNLTLNGTTVVSGVAKLTTARRVLFTPAGAEATNVTVWTVYGTDWNDNTISEVVAGVNNPATAQTLKDFKTVTQIAVNKAQAGAVTVGTSGVASSRPIFLDTFAPALTSLQVDVVGTVNFTIQQSLDDPNVVGYDNVVWINYPDSSLAAATASAQGNYAYLPAVTRIVINSGTGSVRYTVIQADA